MSKSKYPVSMVAALLSVILLGTSAAAQTTGSVMGFVRDATGQPIASQRVTFTSAALMTERKTLTDAAGWFQFDHLAPGTYRVRVTREGFEPFRAGDIRVSPTATARVDVSLQPKGAAAAPSRSTAVDVTTSVQGVQLNPAFFDRVPVIRPNATGLRSFEDLSVVAPQVTRERLGFGINGGLSSETLYLVDGMQVNDPTFGSLRTPLGIGGAQLPLEFLEAVDVTTGGSSPVFGGASGGVVNAVTKSGGNELHGSVFGSWWPGALTANARALPNDTTSFDVASKRHNTGDFGAEVGGAVVKDRLWFYAGVVQAVDRQRVTQTTKRFLLADDGSLARNDFGVLQTEPFERFSRFDDRRSTTWLGKLTLRITDQQTLSATVFGGPQQRTLQPFPTLVGGALDRTDSTTASLRYFGRFFDDALTVEATAGWNRTSHALLPGDGTRRGDLTGGAAAPRTVLADDLARSVDGCPEGSACPSTSINAPLATGGRGLLLESDADRLQTRAVVGVRFSLLGHHLVRAGADLDWTQARSTRSFSGDALTVETRAGSSLDTSIERSAPAQLGVGAFLDERWNVMDALTLNAGLRYDSQHFFDVGRHAFSLNTQLSPRLGLAYDVTRSGRGKVFASWAVHHQRLPLELARPAIDGSARTRPGPATCDPLDTSRPRNECSTSPAIEQGTVLVDSSIRPMAHGELTAGLEYEVLSNLRVSLIGTHRWLISSVELLSADEGASVFLGTPGVGLAGDFKAADRKYFAATLAASRSFDGWLAQGSYTLSSLTGNTAGLFRQGPASGDVHLRSMEQNETGFLPADTSHQFKLYVAKDFELSSDLSLIVGATYESLSGTPVSYLSRHPVAGLDAWYALQRGSAGRTPWTHTVNVRAGLNWKVTNEQTMQVTLDVFNLLNLQEVTAVDQRLSTREVPPVVLAEGQDPGKAACLAGNVPTCQTVLQPNPGAGPLLNPTFKQPLAYQQPLSVRLGVRWSF